MYINTPAWLPRKLGRQTCVAGRQRENWGKVRRDKKKGREKGKRKVGLCSHVCVRAPEYLRVVAVIENCWSLGRLAGDHSGPSESI